MHQPHGLLALLCFYFALTTSCTIHPSDGPFSCKNGHACPPGQTCGDDQKCHVKQTSSAGCKSNSDCQSDEECREQDCVKLGKIEMRDGGGGGSIPDTGIAAAPDTGPSGPERCQNDARRCAAANVPERCLDGVWSAQAPCSGTTPACTNGACASVKLHGSIVTVRDTTADSGKVRLVEHGLEYIRPSCSVTVQGKSVCFSGGIAP